MINIRNCFFFIGILTLLVACNSEQTSKTKSLATSNATQQIKTFNWKMVTTWPPRYPIFMDGVEKFVHDIEVMSKGRLVIKVYAGGELVPPLQSFDAVTQGTVEMGHGAAYYWAGKVPAAQFFTSVPFGLNAQGMTSWLYGGGGLELWQDLYKEFNLVPFPMGNTGVQMGGWFNKKINSLDDIKGLRMRMPGLGGKVLAKAGATPVLIAGGEIYTALERGTIDATEWVGPFHDQLLGLQRAAKYYYFPGWHEPGAQGELIINKKAWDQLPPDLKKMVEVVSQSTGMWMFAQFEAKNIAALHKLKASTKVEVLEFPDDVIRELRRLTEQVYAEESQKDEKFKKIFTAFKIYQEKNQEWNLVSEAAYQKALNIK